MTEEIIPNVLIEGQDPKTVELNEAVDQLPEKEKKVAEPFIFGMSYSDLTSLAVEIVQVYDDICQCLSSFDQPHVVPVERIT